MEYQEKTKWLGRYRESVCRQRMLEDELAALRSDAERMTACISGMPGRGGVNADRLPKAVERIEEAQKNLEQQVGICLDERMDVMNAILSVGTKASARCCAAATSQARASARSPPIWGWCRAGSTSCTVRA